MARVKTNVVNVKVDDKGTKVTVKVECADVALVNVEALQRMYESQWKQFMYSTVQATIKEMYASVAANKQVVESMRTIFHATDERIFQIGGPARLDKLLRRIARKHPPRVHERDTVTAHSLVHKMSRDEDRHALFSRKIDQ